MKKVKWIAFCTVFLACLGFYFFQEVLAQTKVPPPLQPGIRDRTKGQPVAFQNDAEILAWCDFEKQIVVTRTNVLCVYNGAADPQPPPPASP